MEYPFIVGTAGHIDHGKTSLVKAMTGVDCDRLEEEKRRGITIELGFAHLDLASGKTVGIIDVPGHERFIRQMAAGASGMDAAMLIVAANEGVMPQTREHLDILNLLGVKSGLVALTKKDLVDGETLEIALEEARELIRGSCLEGAAVIPVCALSGEGTPEIYAEIERILSLSAPRAGFGAFFMPIDRVFSKKGFGAVITGTVFQGGAAEGDEIEILPAGHTGKARSLQAHGSKVAAVKSGQRTAINLASVSHDKISRGDAACAKGTFLPTNCFSAQVQMLPKARTGLFHRQRVRLHVGTADVAARISLLRLGEKEKKEGYPPGSSGPVQIFPESEIAAAAGERFIIRFYSPLVTIGGGQIALPNAERALSKAERDGKAALVSALVAGFSPLSFLAAIVGDRGLVNASGLFELSQMGKSSFAENAEALSRAGEKYGVLEFGKTGSFISKAAFSSAAAAVKKNLLKFHVSHPELSGAEAEKLRPALDTLKQIGKISGGDFKALLAMMAGKNLIAASELHGRVFYRDCGFTPPSDAKFEAAVSKARGAIEAAGFNLLTEAELEEKTALGAADIKRVLAYLRDQDDLRAIKEGLLFSRSARGKLLSVLEAMRQDITVAALRDSIGASRKYALAMLEFFDAQGITRRDGDRRLLVKGP